MTSLTFKSLPPSEQSNTPKLIGIPPRVISALIYFIFTPPFSIPHAGLHPLYGRCSLTVSLRHPIGIIEQGQMIKGPMTINAGEIKNSSHLLHLAFSGVSQCSSPPFRPTQVLKDWDWGLYLRRDLISQGED